MPNEPSWKVGVSPANALREDADRARWHQKPALSNFVVENVSRKSKRAFLFGHL